MVWIVYNLLFPFVFLAMLPYQLFRMWRRGGYGRGFAQRLGLYDTAVRARIQARPRIWVHAVSVGEAFVALKFMEEWRRREPAVAFVMSVNTSTARAMVEKMLHPDDVWIYFPVDFPPVIRGVLNMLRPRLLVLTECEFWPNLMRMAQRRDVPIFLINGRMSDRSFRGYRRFGWLFAPVMKLVDGLCVQGQQDAERFVAVGADPARVTVSGSAKYDVALQDPGNVEKGRAILETVGIGGEERVLLGGSTWPGEEEALLEIYGRLKALTPALRLVLVPRHAERRDEVAEAIRRRGFRFVQRSKGVAATEGGPVEVLLADTTGELKHLYAAATVVFVGKSLPPQHGGQNIIEPAVCGKPILVGPNMRNFPDVIRDFRAAEALVQVADAGELEAQIARFLADPALRQTYGSKASALVEKNRGALSQTVDRARRMLAAGHEAAAATMSLP
jgi:3-deoxy-D-manno-octulosonic-acid transferase